MAAPSTNAPSTRTGLRRLALGCGALLLAVPLALTITMFACHRPRPAGRASPEADALADRIERAVHLDAWQRTGAVRWTFVRTGARHLWDRERDWARIRWDTYEVQVDLNDPRRGVAFDGAARVADARSLIHDGWKRWVNDAFWLAAPFKLRDPGVTRSLVEVDGEDALLVEYASGGATPGDAYLWRLASDGTPRAWRLWVSVIPIGGVEMSWEGWVTLPTGARIATIHRAGSITATALDDVEGAETLSQLEAGPDPFAALAGL